MTPRLLALLRFFKGEEEFTGWRQIPQVLAEEYHHEMSFPVVLGHLVEAYIEVMKEPRFQVGSNTNELIDILLAPVSIFYSVAPGSIVSLQSTVTIERFYDSIIWKIRDVLAYQTNIGWCRDLIYPCEAAGHSLTTS